MVNLVHKRRLDHSTRILTQVTKGIRNTLSTVSVLIGSKTVILKEEEEERNDVEEREEKLSTTLNSFLAKVDNKCLLLSFSFSLTFFIVPFAASPILSLSLTHPKFSLSPALSRASLFFRSRIYHLYTVKKNTKGFSSSRLLA